MYDIRKTEKEFIAKNRLMFKGKHLGYQGNLSIRGKNSNTCDITLAYLDNININYAITLNSKQLGKDIEMVADGKLLYSHKDTPILQDFNIYRILGFNEYRNNNTILQKKYRDLSNKYFQNKYRNCIIITDGHMRTKVEVNQLSKDVIEVHVKSRLVGLEDEHMLLYALLSLEHSRGAYTNTLEEMIQDFNNKNGVAVFTTPALVGDTGTKEVTCLTCGEVKSLKNVQCLKNYRCKCGGVLRG